LRALVDGGGRGLAASLPYSIVFTPDYEFRITNKGFALKNLVGLNTNIRIGQVIGQFQATFADPTDDLYKEIDSMDEIEIYLKGIGGAFEKVFTGFVDSSVRAYDSSAQHRVKISGSTPFKLFHITALDKETIRKKAYGLLKYRRKSAEIIQDIAERVGIPRQNIKISLKNDYDVSLLVDPSSLIQIFHPDYAKFSSILSSITIAASHEFFFDEDGCLIYRDTPYFQSPSIRITDDLIQNMTIKREDAPYVTHVHVYGTPYGEGYKIPAHAQLTDIELDIPINMEKYRERRVVFNCPWIIDTAAAQAHADYMLFVLNASMISGAVTVPGLPRVKLGSSVEITSFEKIYYVSSIQHIYQEDQSFMTTLGLSYGRPIGGNWRILGKQVLETPAGSQEETIRRAYEVLAAEQAGLLEPGETVSGFIVPLADGTYRVSSNFGDYRPWPPHHHQGIDLAAPGNTPIYAAREGIVQEAGWATGYGYTVKILHNNGYTTRYAHMPGQPPVQEGQGVDAGSYIGKVDDTGWSDGNHLHFEVRDPSGNPVDPRNYLDV